MFTYPYVVFYQCPCGDCAPRFQEVQGGQYIEDFCDYLENKDVPYQIFTRVTKQSVKRNVVRMKNAD